ncbi:hypothetical protein G7Y89_g6531 [Cudoniella acicularis]|uniref:Xylanolytic transcriptional activator regulatory domain-containing protein n=1 Tax=Cudoniella acicularis TaxID=354080 RepID=A0A8H4RK97_9HELO|nr:hypothetical protein G7Y89_g6531 [Cudoniella acicularis]
MVCRDTVDEPNAIPGYSPTGGQTQSAYIEGGVAPGDTLLNIAFTRHISRAMTRASRSSPFPFGMESNTSPGIQFDSAFVSVSQPPSPSGRPRPSTIEARSLDKDRINIYALPSETTTRELMVQYFGDTGLLFPYIHQQTFLETYDEMKTNNFTKVRRTWLGLLNMIMALATSTTVEEGLSAERRAKQSNVYYQRASGLCEKQIMRGTSLEVVQHLILASQYLQGTQRSVETWTIHGLTVKAALQLGLHSAAASSRFSLLDQEIRKRTWYACVVLDRTLSMTFGRPAAIPDDYVRIQLPIHLGPGDGTDGVLQEVSVAFFNATITLYKIMWTVIDLSYGGNIGCDPPTSAFDTVSRLFGLEQQMVDWERRLPKSLGLPEASHLTITSNVIDPITSSLSRFRIILAVRYLNLRVLLHRPILVKFLDITGNNANDLDVQEVNLIQQIGSNSVLVCVESSMKIIAIVSTIVASRGSQRTWLGAWWFSLYYTFNAALVIFATLLIVEDRVINGTVRLSLPVSELDLKRSLADAALALRRLDCENHMVDRCAAYLEQLAGVIEALTTIPGAAPDLSNMAYGDSASSTLQSLYNANSPLPLSAESIVMNTSPLGMDFGEFMLEGDIEFLNQLVGVGSAQGINKSNKNVGTLKENSKAG